MSYINMSKLRESDEISLLPIDETVAPSECQFYENMSASKLQEYEKMEVPEYPMYENVGTLELQACTNMPQVLNCQKEKLESNKVHYSEIIFTSPVNGKLIASQSNEAIVVSECQTYDNMPPQKCKTSKIPVCPIHNKDPKRIQSEIRPTSYKNMAGSECLPYENMPASSSQTYENLPVLLPTAASNSDISNILSQNKKNLNSNKNSNPKITYQYSFWYIKGNKNARTSNKVTQNGATMNNRNSGSNMNHNTLTSSTESFEITSPFSEVGEVSSQTTACEWFIKQCTLKNVAISVMIFLIIYFVVLVTYICLHYMKRN